jgi:general secretion pathway protein H
VASRAKRGILPESPSLAPPGALHRGPDAGRIRGFTLVEILVVIVIVGVIISFAVLSIGGRAVDERLDNEARRLRELITLAADEAVLQGTELGFVQTVEGYAFLALRDGKWGYAAAEGPMRPRLLEPPFRIQLRVDGRPAAPLALDDERVELKPQVLLLSSGEATEFSLELRAHQHPAYYRLQGDALGRVTLERKDAAS